MKPSLQYHRCRRLAVVAVLAFGLVMAGCASTFPDRDPTGETFPALSGARLSGESVALPGDLPDEPVLLMVGYKQDTQFDIDRWLLAINQAGLTIHTLELPTIPGLLPGLFANNIDSGMRSGIPETDWPAVVTVYQDAETLTRFTGNTNGLPARVILLDRRRTVRFFWDQGYSTTALNSLTVAVNSLR